MRSRCAKPAELPWEAQMKRFTSVRSMRAIQSAGVVSLALLAACEPSSALAAEAADTAAGVTETVGRLVGLRFLAGGNTGAVRQAAEWRTSRPADAILMEKLAAQPVAKWVNEWVPLSEIGRTFTRAAGTGATPVFVAYNIPNRDLGSYSAGGATDAAAYRQWIRDFAAALAGRRSIVVLEPDAVPQTARMTAAGRDERFALLRDAIQVLKAANAMVYLDAGNARWMSPEAAAAALQAAGIDQADGFSLNVSNYISTSTNFSYGEQISRRTGGKHFLIDTSRNGMGGTADAQWCNVPGQSLGTEPTTETGHPLVDALLWIKVPGESDGTCNGGPRSGAWWGEYALGLAQRSMTVASSN
jgi:endoglucanase